MEHYHCKTEEAEQERLNFKRYIAKQKALDDSKPLTTDGNKGKKRKADNMEDVGVKKPRYD